VENDVKTASTEYIKSDTLTSGGIQKEVYEDMVMIRKKNNPEMVTNDFQRRRIEAGLRQKDLAEAINRPVSYIGRIENETLNINNVSMRNGYKMAQVLGCRMEDLVDKSDIER
jgi:DNA-binding XRE family transcriptional regulator